MDMYMSMYMHMHMYISMPMPMSMSMDMDVDMVAIAMRMCSMHGHHTYARPCVRMQVCSELAYRDLSRRSPLWRGSCAGSAGRDPSDRGGSSGRGAASTGYRVQTVEPGTSSMRTARPSDRPLGRVQDRVQDRVQLTAQAPLGPRVALFPAGAAAIT